MKKIALFSLLISQFLFAKTPNYVIEKVEMLTLYGVVDYEWAKKLLRKEGLVPVKTMIGDKAVTVSGFGVSKMGNAYDPLRGHKSRNSFYDIFIALSAKKPGSKDQTPGYYFFNIGVTNEKVQQDLVFKTAQPYSLQHQIFLDFGGPEEGAKISGLLSSEMGAAPFADLSNGNTPDPKSTVAVIPQNSPIKVRVFSKKTALGQVEYNMNFIYPKNGKLYSRKYNEKIGDSLNIDDMSHEWRKYFIESNFIPDFWLFTKSPKIQFSNIKNL